MRRSSHVPPDHVPACRFRDVRHERRAHRLFERLLERPTANLKQLSHSRAEQVAASAFLHHPDTHVETLIHSVVEQTRSIVRAAHPAHVLLVSDTSEVNLHAQRGFHAGRGLGVAGNHRDEGFFIHLGQVLDPAQGQPFGCTSLQVWTRQGPRNFDSVESRKWFRVLDDGHRLDLAPHVTLINDREGDIFALWRAVQVAGFQLLTRAKQDRRIAVTASCQGGKLFADVAAQPCLGQITVSLKAKTSRHVVRQARMAQLEVRHVDVALLEPRQSRHQASQIKLSAIELRECPTSVPLGERPLVWVLLSTHPVHSLADARQLVQWYLYRWRIEEVFSALKTRGLDLEATHLHHGQAIMKLCVMALWSAIRLTALVQGRTDDVTSASACFDADEQRCLEALQPKFEGRTPAQRNPYRVHSLAWAVWIIARLGHWHGQGPPGLSTLRLGLERFEAAFLGWHSAQPP
jgi:hypothetical protein